MEIMDFWAKESMKTSLSNYSIMLLQTSLSKIKCHWKTLNKLLVDTFLCLLVKNW